MHVQVLIALAVAAAAEQPPRPATTTPSPVSPEKRADDAAQPRDTTTGASAGVRVDLPTTNIETSGTTLPAAVGVTPYPAAFFAENRPQTAMDMINRLPGFTFSGGDSVRGFSGAAGNVLIDGRRPATKSDGLESVLSRILAREVDRIEVVRGGAPGIDMQGRAVVANVIRKTGNASRVTVVYNNALWEDGHTVPGGKIEFNKRVGAHTFEGALSRYQSFDDSVGDGRLVTTTAPGTPGAFVTSVPAHTSADGGGVGLTTTYKGPQLGGDLRANLKLEETYFKSGLSYGEHPPAVIINDRSRGRKAEVGLNYDRKLGPYELETVFLQRLGRSFNGEAQTAPGPADAPSLTTFSQVNNTGESIGRFLVRRAWTPRLTIEAGAEGAFNFLDGSTRFTQDGVDIPLPSADVRVEELRGEGFLQARWRATDKLTLESALRLETSTITETGDAQAERSFFYVKPRFNLTWSPTADDQLRLRAEKKVGQLNFSDFVSQADLQGATFNGGNPDLRPDQRWQLEATYERRFWGRGAVVVSYLHEEIEDVVDLLPIIGPDFAFDSPGNIGPGKNDELSITGTFPLDKLGVSGGLLKTTSTWRVSEVVDPLTRQTRRISGQRPDVIQLDFTQDIDRLRSTWGASWFYGWRETYYRLNEIQRFRIPPPGYFAVFWDWKPRPDLALKISLQNLVPFTFERKRTIYAGPRDRSPLDAQEDRTLQSQPRIDIRFRKTFG